MNNKMSSDESSVENVSIRDRPMNIAEDLYNFCSNEWLEAKMALDEKYKGDEENLLRFLNAVLMVSVIFGVSIGYNNNRNKVKHDMS